MGTRGRPSDAEYAEFVHVSWPRLYRTAYLLVADHGLAEDLVQTALARTYVAWPRIEDPNAATAYARTCVTNEALTWFRRRGWRAEVVGEPSSEQPADHQDPATRPTLLAALRQLAPRQRAVIVLRYYADASVAETAQTLGCSTGTVKSQTSDALAKLRVLLGDTVIPATIPAIADSNPFGGTHD
jgi:RNA polymerase sigma-70 factor (sigma-E family)